MENAIFALRSFALLRYQEFASRCRSETFRNGLYLLIALQSALILLTLLADQFQLDLRWVSEFHNSNQGWYLQKEQPWYWLYRYGTLPGLALAAFGLIGFYLSRTRASWKGLQRHFLLVVMTLIIGPGLMVNAIGKDYWGRPRPEQVREFGGQWEYRSVFSPGIPGRGKSFPCGHCTMGYAFLTLVVFWKRSRMLAWAGGLTALVYGSLLGVARMAAGAHFPTDVLWSLGIVAMVITVLYYWVFRIPDFHNVRHDQATLTHDGWLALKLFAVGLAILFAFLSRRPYYSSSAQSVAIPEQACHLVVHANVNFTKTSISTIAGEAPHAVINAKGFAFPRARHSIVSHQEQIGDTVHLYHEIERSGYHSELNYTYELILPPHLKNKLQVNLNASRE